jgi:hypothetical protein
VPRYADKPHYVKLLDRRPFSPAASLLLCCVKSIGDAVGATTDATPFDLIKLSIQLEAYRFAPRKTISWCVSLSATRASTDPDRRPRGGRGLSSRRRCCRDQSCWATTRSSCSKRFFRDVASVAAAINALNGLAGTGTVGWHAFAVVPVNVFTGRRNHRFCRGHRSSRVIIANRN